MRSNREDGGRPPKIRVPSTGPLSRALITGAGSIVTQRTGGNLRQLDVVDGGHRFTVAVEHLPVQQMQPGVDQPARQGLAPGGRSLTSQPP